MTANTWIRIDVMSNNKNDLFFSLVSELSRETKTRIAGIRHKQCESFGHRLRSMFGNTIITSNTKPIALRVSNMKT